MAFIARPNIRFRRTPCLKVFWAISVSERPNMKPNIEVTSILGFKLSLMLGLCYLFVTSMLGIEDALMGVNLLKIRQLRNRNVRSYGK